MARLPYRIIRQAGNMADSIRVWNAAAAVIIPPTILWKGNKCLYKQ